MVERRAGRVEHAGRQVESLAGHHQVGPGVLQDQIILPLHQVGQQDVLVSLLDDVGMDAEEGLRVWPQVNVLREVVGFLFRVRADQCRVFLIWCRWYGMRAAKS